MEKILITYAPKGGYTEMVASRICSKLDNVEYVCIAGSDLTVEIFREFSNIIIGVATLGSDSWNSGNLDDDSVHLQKIITYFDFSNKKVALFGLGNSILYPSNFVDEIGIYAKKIEEKNAKLIGFTSTEGYNFRDSKALISSNTLSGLALDNDNESEKTELRLNDWLQQIISEFKA